MTGSTFITGDGNQIGDRIDARHAQGFLNKPTGSVNQHFGDQHTVTTGGDYAEGDIDKRQGAFVSGGTVYGAVVGTNSGVITSHSGSAGAAVSDPLDQAIALAQQLITTAHQRGASTLAEDLQDVINALQAAQRATADPARRATKLQLARTALTALGTSAPEVQPLISQLQGVA